MYIQVVQDRHDLITDSLHEQSIIGHRISSCAHAQCLAITKNKTVGALPLAQKFSRLYHSATQYISCCSSCKCGAPHSVRSSSVHTSRRTLHDASEFPPHLARRLSTSQACNPATLRLPATPGDPPGNPINFIMSFSFCYISPFVIHPWGTRVSV